MAEPCPGTSAIGLEVVLLHRAASLHLVGPGVTTSQLEPERVQMAKTAVRTIMWPDGDRSRRFRNETQLASGQDKRAQSRSASRRRQFVRPPAVSSAERRFLCLLVAPQSKGITMPPHPVKQVIEAADRAIAAEDFDALMDFYEDDAVLVVTPGLYARGKEEIRLAFVRIAEHFNHSIVVKQGAMVVIEAGDTSLVIGETFLDFVEKNGSHTSITRRATYVFRQSVAGEWRCKIDNSYGTDLLMSE
jgi:uncharacterized protein (TIGR02246 family)